MIYLHSLVFLIHFSSNVLVSFTELLCFLELYAHT